MAAISTIQPPLDTRLAVQVKDGLAEETDQKQPAPAKAPPVKEDAPVIDQSEISKLVQEVQEKIDEVSPDGHKVGFHQDPGSEAFVIEITDSEGRMVKQFPPEKVLNLRRKLAELSGMVVDEII